MQKTGPNNHDKPDPRGTAPALVKAPVPSLPKGGGAIRGIGEKFSTNAVTGTGTLAVPIATTAARSGFHPELALSYDSGSGNGPFGLGWHISVPSITRKTDKRLPEYRDAEESDVFLLSGAEDLVPALDTAGERIEFIREGRRIRRYRPRIEGLFARIERHEDTTTGDVHWVSIDPSNVRSIYGRSANSRIVDPRDPRRVFSWLLERSEDAFGNVIVYEYVAEDLANVPARPAEIHRLGGDARVANRYLKRIRYGNTTPSDEGTCVFEVVFDYGEHDLTRPEPEAVRGWPARQDAFSAYRAGFEVRTYRLCRRVLMFHRFAELGPIPCLVRATLLHYDENSTLTKLVAVEQAGYIRPPGELDYTSQSLPLLRFGYTAVQIESVVRTLDHASLADLPAGVADKSNQWVDLDGEGIPGVLTDDGGALYYRRNLGRGALAPARRLMTRPSLMALASSSTQQQLMDLGGEGRLDLVTFGPPMPGFHERIPPGERELPRGERDDGGWQPFRTFASHPEIDWNDPNLRFIDLNGDGLDDLLLARDDVFVWYPSLGKQGFGPPRTFPRPHDEENGPALAFADKTQTIFLADLGGDGLRDLVRVTNGGVCYWPNLGHGHFGAKVTMAGAPVFDRPEAFDPKRILFADIDGSGTTDLLYIGRDGIRFWFNQAGNSWSTAHELPELPATDSAASVSAVGILGTGTACLVWSTPLPGEQLARVRYIDLLAGRKPHLLESMNNGLGFETRLRYATSTKFYLADRAAGRPWATRLAFPVHVLERVETYDAVRRVRFVSEYRYRDGYFDGDEREFRGFGYVEQWDTEFDPALSGKGLFADRPPPVNGELPQPPVVTKTWFHVGAWLSDAGERPMVLPAGLSPAESRDAYRALKGQLLRQEVFVHDGSPLEGEPYTVSEKTWEVRQIQPAQGEAPAVFFTHAREAIDWHCERDRSDPRVQHALTLAVDECGHVRRSVAIGYPRRNVVDRRAEQRELAMTATEVEVANVVDEEGWYRHGVPLETRTYELTGLSHDGDAPLFTFEQVAIATASATTIAYDEKSARGKLEKRLIERVRARYFDRRSLPAPLPFGRIDDLALPYETYGLAFTASLVSALYGGRVTDEILVEGGYVHLDDPSDPESATGWWVPSGRAIPAGPFYLPTEFRDPFGHTTAIAYDHYALLATWSRDPKGNVVRLENDYRTMAPSLVVDPNENRSAAEVDALGRVVATRVMGKAGSTDGDPLPGLPTTILDYACYDAATGQPSVVHVAARETHGVTDTKWQHSYSYSDGSGHEVMKKVRAEPFPGTATPRWVGTGRTVFDNKGNPVKKFEPFFSATHEYETDEELVERGVTPILHYDPLGRLVRTEMPDGSLSRVTFTPWRQESWDANDTVLDPGNLWQAKHAGSRVAKLTARHAGTPTVTILDTLGRTCASIADNGPDGKYETRTTLDIEGNPLVIRDARGNDAMVRAFSMLGQVCHQKSIDAGERWTIVNVAGNPVRAWDSRGHTIRSTYDELQRPTHLFVRDSGGIEILAERTVYGEEHQEARGLNLRGKVWQHYDSAGLVTNDAFDFKGNTLTATRQLAVEYRELLDWSIAPAPQLEDEKFTNITAYDAINRPTGTTTPDGSETRPTYNEAGLLNKVDVRLRGAATWTPFVANIDYDEKGQRLRIVYAMQAVATDYLYDPLTFRLHALKTMRRSDGKRLQDLRYTYDANGNIVAIEDHAQPEVFFNGNVIDGSVLYEYDALYRLTRAQGREHAGGLADVQREDRDIPTKNLPHANDGQALRPYVQEYAYDPVGNIDRMRHTAIGNTAASWTRSYQYLPDSNRLDITTFPGDTAPTRYPHDLSGNMTAMPHLARIDWNFKDQMHSVNRGGGGVVYFAYDAAGQRVRKVWEHRSVVEERLYIGGYEIYRKHTGQTLKVERQTLHISDDTLRIALIETKTINADAPLKARPRIRFQLGNHLGSVALEMDEKGKVISYEEYHPYGTSAYRAADGDVEISPKRYRYTGKERDEETGLFYHGARYYAPWVARWTAADPAGMVDGSDIYVYARDNPVRFSDPAGTQSWCADVIAIGGLIPDPDCEPSQKPYFMWPPRPGSKTDTPSPTAAPAHSKVGPAKENAVSIEKLKGIAKATALHYRYPKNTERMFGAAKAVGGLLQLGGALFLSETIVGGIALGLQGADDYATGMRQLATGEPEHSFKYRLGRLATEQVTTDKAWQNVGGQGLELLGGAGAAGAGIYDFTRPLSMASLEAQTLRFRPFVTDDLVEIAHYRAEHVMLTQGKNARGAVLSTVQDSLTGGFFFDQNAVHDPASLLCKRLDTYNSLMEGTTPPKLLAPGAHSEFGAMAQALRARHSLTGKPVTEGELGQFYYYNVALRGKWVGQGVWPCFNCDALLIGARHIGPYLDHVRY